MIINFKIQILIIIIFNNNLFHFYLLSFFYLLVIILEVFYPTLLIFILLFSIPDSSLNLLVFLLVLLMIPDLMFEEFWSVFKISFYSDYSSTISLPDFDLLFLLEFCYDYGAMLIWITLDCNLLGDAEAFLPKLFPLSTSVALMLTISFWGILLRGP